MKSIYYFIIWTCQDWWKNLNEFVRSKYFAGLIIWSIAGGLIGRTFTDLALKDDEHFNIDATLCLVWISVWTLRGRWKQFRAHQQDVLNKLQN